MTIIPPAPSQRLFAAWPSLLFPIEWPPAPALQRRITRRFISGLSCISHRRRGWQRLAVAGIHAGRKAGAYGPAASGGNILDAPSFTASARQLEARAASGRTADSKLLGEECGFGAVPPAGEVSGKTAKTVWSGALHGLRSMLPEPLRMPHVGAATHATLQNGPGGMRISCE